MLLKAIDDDAALKERIYLCEETDQVIPNLKLQGYYFDKDELEEAIYFLQVQCQTAKEAQYLRYKADWLLFLTEVATLAYQAPLYFL